MQRYMASWISRKPAEFAAAFVHVVRAVGAKKIWVGRVGRVSIHVTVADIITEFVRFVPFWLIVLSFVSAFAYAFYIAFAR